MQAQLTIAVTGLNATDNPGPGLAVIRALRQGFENLRVIGLSYEALEPAAYLHHLVDKTYQIPYPSAGAGNLLERLLAIHNEESLQLIIPNFDSELFNFIRIAPQLEASGIRTFLPSHSQLTERDKPNLASFGREHGFDTPRESVLHHAGEVAKAAQELGCPLVVKGKFYEAVIAHQPEAAIKAFHHLSAKWGTPVIAQQFVSGTEVNLAGLGDGEGNAISLVPMRKLYITDKGKAWAGVTISDESLITLATRFVRKTQWRGGFELELIRDKSGRLFILEINPRFPAWVYLAAAAGQNQPAALVRMALGEKVEPFSEYEVGKMFIRYAWDHVTDISEFQQLSAMGELGNLQTAHP